MTKNNDNPAVSVIIPVYNAEKYLQQCLDSIINQTLQDIEIICVDDGSQDDSLEILNDYAKKDDRIIVLTQSNINAGAARNRGLSVAKGKYLSFLDADDYFELDMLETAFIKAEEQFAEITIFGSDRFGFGSESRSVIEHSIVWENVPEETVFAGASVKKDLFGTFVGWTWDKLFLREYVLGNHIRFQEQRTTNDLFFTYFALAKASRITAFKNVFAHHRTAVKTSLESTRDQSWDCFYKALCMLKERLIAENLYDHYRNDFLNYCVHFTYWNIDTLEWPTQEVLFVLLKSVWFLNLGVLGMRKADFYREEEYHRLVEIMNGTYVNVFPAGGSVYHYKTELARASDELAWTSDELARTSDELTLKNDELGRLKDELVFVRTSETYYKADCMRLTGKLTSLRNSLSFRIGRRITWLPRMIRQMIRAD